MCGYLPPPRTALTIFFIFFFSLSDCGRKWRSGSPADFMNYMKKIRGMVTVEAFCHIIDQPFPLIAGTLNHLDRNITNPLSQRLVPGSS